MKASFRNCRKRWVFSICREQDKTANRIGKKMMIWLSHGHLMAQFDCILLCCFWFFTKELCIIIKIKVRECSFKNQFTTCHYKLGLVFFTSFFTAGSIIFQKREIPVLLMMEWNHSYSWRSVFMHLHFHKICIKFCIIRIVQRLFISKY